MADQPSGRVLPFRAPTADPDVVGVLQDALAKARRGELTAVAVVAVHAKGELFASYEAGDDTVRLQQALRGALAEMAGREPVSRDVAPTTERSPGVDPVA